MENFSLSIPLARVQRIDSIDQQNVKLDIEYLAQLVGLANKIGLEGKTISTLCVDPSEDGQHCTIKFEYET